LRPLAVHFFGLTKTLKGLLTKLELFEHWKIPFRYLCLLPGKNWKVVNFSLVQGSVVHSFAVSAADLVKLMDWAV
jgi:hypothetical protein